MIKPIIPGTRLHFPWAKVTKALAEVRVSTGIRTLYGAETGPGLWLVGDHGVYLMPNTTSGARNIVYARERDPTKLDFETWWANKSATFGSDDGVDFIPLRDIDAIAAEFLKSKQRPRHFHVDITPENFSIGVG